MYLLFQYHHFNANEVSSVVIKGVCVFGLIRKVLDDLEFQPLAFDECPRGKEGRGNIKPIANNGNESHFIIVIE